MAELITIARPYAEAAFRFAKEQNALKDWSDVLSNLAAIASNDDMAKFLANPSRSKEQKVDVFVSLLGSANLSKEVKNFLDALAEQGRLTALSSVSSVFEELKASEEKRLKASIASAVELNDEQKSKLSAALNSKFGADVDVEYITDSALIAGVRIKVGDWVVENTAVTQIQKLGAAIAH
ncbi:F0F1 ATP synthase subunit delta [Thiomicrospira sp. ALE5]|uniref:F0F1 ATP synthase subunit delta n=1 Tax=Thiomicrospira sp. ALE5 TaxID=748650 RepID=UPI0008EC7C7E|nr:F0F1 ATP synthase subunit delta [Thiomicrospira sp. ALE5]SFR56199.1 F-type H+-transporting ATPase subunit delta [Thiomicrospira sp. ALE5]